jgi:phage baseplate assembly protein W
MADLKIVTKQIPGVEPRPPQPGNPTEYFGEQSNDLQLSNVNDFDTVSGIDKLKQDLNKILLTEIGANSNFDVYGTELQTLVGGKSNPDTVRARIQASVDDALSVLEYLNRENTNDDEVPAIFETLSVEELEDGKFEIQISVLARSGERISSDPVILG